ncbi:hypothetical protein QQ045_018362 [Rhodiola kirilowii]
MDDLFWLGEAENAEARRNVNEALNRMEIDVLSYEGVGNQNSIDEEDINVDSDELETAADTTSDEDVPTEPQYLYFNERTGFGSKMEFEIGLRYRNIDVFRKALRYHAIRKGFDYDLVNNSKKKISVQCKCKDCPWRMSASWSVDKQGSRSFQVKRLTPHDKNNCARDLKNKKVTSKFLAEFYQDAFEDNTKWEIEAFQKHVRRDLNVDVSHAKCRRAKKLALEYLAGKVGDQYKIIREYCTALQKWNPGTSAHLTTEDRRFQRIYVCPNACKQGFVTGCRPIISLDACHLKGSFTGQIHSAIGRDGNDNMFPIAYAICEAETKETWTWFIQNLLSDIHNSKDNKWTFISDQQKGLVEALKDLTPGSEHRLCVRHLYANFSKIYKGKELKDAMWSCARASTLNQHKEAMEFLKELDKDAFAYLEKLDKTTWCRHAFKYYALSDSLCSNISECFNAFIKTARDQPIISCLETIRKLLMRRFNEKFEGMQKYEGEICPRIWKKLENNRVQGMGCHLTWGGGITFQVESSK